LFVTTNNLAAPRPGDSTRRRYHWRMSASPDLLIRPAQLADVPALVALLAQDVVGPRRRRDDPGPPLPAEYAEAFAAICADANNLLIAVELEDKVVGTMQLTFVRQLSHRGGTACIVEAVRVAAGLRSRGIGAAMMHWAQAEAARRGCFRVQLTSHGDRRDAHRFYERLGFAASHVGFKRDL
jgi:GNAT superfamily N-acetyltransferase